ncbi:MAG: glycosyltransferase family 39 protein, partial [Elusimicrobia bacterium]|nr:glycosyltransferase family 39 protein [Elusimicrobiota bacterium]
MKNFIRANIFFFFILFVICFAVYGKAMNFGITRLDDDKLTVNNINYISDYKNIPKFFKTDCYHASGHLYYRPILSLSFSLESMFFGYNTKVYHTTNILLFILSLFLIFVFLSKFNFNKNILKFLIVLCAVHPILASVPAWLPARNDSLLTIFLISSFIFFIKYLSSKKYSHLFLYLFFYALSVFTKETALIMIIIFPFLTILPFTNSPFRLKHKLC